MIIDWPKCGPNTCKHSVLRESWEVRSPIPLVRSAIRRAARRKPEILNKIFKALIFGDFENAVMVLGEIMPQIATDPDSFMKTVNVCRWPETLPKG